MKTNIALHIPLNAVLSMCAAAAAAVGITAVLSPNPLHAAAAFFGGVFSSAYFTGSFLNSMSLLMFAALGACAAIQAGSLNLGGSAQMYAAACLTAYLLRDSSFPAAAAMAAAVFAGGAAALVSGILRVFRGVNELLSSFLLSSALSSVLDYAVGGPLRDQTKNLLAMPFIADIHRIPPLLTVSPFNASFFIAVLMCAAAWFVLAKTKAGRIFRICGTAPEFAAYCGYSPDIAMCAGMFISGALHGLAGFFAVAGTYYTCYAGFAGAAGWNALSAALIVKGHPLFLIPISCILSYIFTSCDYSVLSNNFSFDMSAVVQGIVFFTISAHSLHVFKNKSLKRRIPF
ncbi:MAG: hypothetical protein NC041_01425 [Bacteroides sp.]|nr:hypothetical protein [Prevotella sp.]MCM1407737.1 ABC transporter permease [Treponema brennaborense]MCM1469113.1 hypothetical protein [Bacteroides sp.]